MDLEVLNRQLDAFVAAHYGRDARVERLAPMASGHAGLSFGFEVADGDRLEALVLRLAPKGVRRRGNTDVYRQAPLLRALEHAGLPVPVVRWAEDGERWFEVPFIMTGRLPGTTCPNWEPLQEVLGDGRGAGPVWQEALATLVAFHRFEWATRLASWEQERPLADELFRWDKILAHAPEPAWLRKAEQVREMLVRALPPAEASPVGLVHGDYQPGNILYDLQPGRPPRLVAVLDWELSFIGPQLVDVGWLMVFSDPQSWEGRMRPQGAPEPEELLEAYQDEMHRRFTAAAWFRAFAGYRLGAICCLNVKLHRTGARSDPLWDDFSHSVPALFERARQVLKERSTP